MMIFGQFDNHVCYRDIALHFEWHEKQFATFPVIPLYNYLFLQCSVFLKGCLSILFELTYLYCMVVFCRRNFDSRIDLIYFVFQPLKKLSGVPPLAL